MGLKDFALRFAEMVFSQFPEWRQYGKSLEYDEYEICVPVPFPKDENDVLYIFVEDIDEVMVCFDRYYGYFFSDRYPSENEWAKDVLNFLQGILDEKLIVATIMQGNEISCEIIKANKLNTYPYEILHLRSWNGDFDKD